MVEGSQIDFAAHDNNAKKIYEEMDDFDRAVGEAFDYADSHPELLSLCLPTMKRAVFRLPPRRRTLPKARAVSITVSVRPVILERLYLCSHTVLGPKISVV